MMRAGAARRRELPLRENPAGRLLAWLASGLVCLAVLAFAVAAASQARLRQLALEPRVVTVAVPPSAAGMAAEAELAPVLAALRGLAGTVRLHVVPASDLLPARAPGGATDDLLAALPLPRLVEVAFDPAHELDRAAIAAALAPVASDAVIGEPVTGGAEGTAAMQRLRLLGWAGGILALASLIAGSILVVRGALAAQRETVRLLRSLGAGEAQVARQFEQYAARNGLQGAVLGFLVAIALLVGLAMAGAAWPEAGLAEPRLLLADWLRLAAVPVAAALLAAGAARLTVRLGLARLG
jgi:cell division transport system permease protein